MNFKNIILWFGALIILANIIGFINYYIKRPALFVKTDRAIRFKIISPRKAFELNQKGVPFIDVRTEEEFNMGHIPGAILWLKIENNYAEELQKLNRDTLVLYCSSGCEAAEHLGEFLSGRISVNILIMFGGFEAWMQEGFPYENSVN